ncbi:MAG: hypothetical protein ACI9UR_001732 [Bacteroidia bacterium]|jgi:hypothetical protein
MRRLFLFVFFIAASHISFGQCLDTLNSPNLQPPCFPDFLPVCGCDGVTYRNACYAEFATVQQWEEGPCENIVIDIFPNPAVNWLNATIVTKFESNVNLYVFDRNGNVYYYDYLTSVTNRALIIPVNGFDYGLYVIMAESNGDVQLSKFIKWYE